MSIPDTTLYLSNAHTHIGPAGLSLVDAARSHPDLPLAALIEDLFNSLHARMEAQVAFVRAAVSTSQPTVVTQTVDLSGVTKSLDLLDKRLASLEKTVATLPLPNLSPLQAGLGNLRSDLKSTHDFVVSELPALKSHINSIKPPAPTDITQILRDLSALRSQLDLTFAQTTQRLDKLPRQAISRQDLDVLRADLRTDLASTVAEAASTLKSVGERLAPKPPEPDHHLDDSILQILDTVRRVEVARPIHVSTDTVDLGAIELQLSSIVASLAEVKARLATPWWKRLLTYLRSKF